MKFHQFFSMQNFSIINISFQKKEGVGIYEKRYIKCNNSNGGGEKFD